MTTEALDLLTQLLDPNAAKERSIQREFGRSPLINFTATVYIDPDQPTIQVNQGGKNGGIQWTETHLAVHMKDAEVTKHDNYNWSEETDYLITMKVPDGGFDAREDDEAVLFMAGLQKLIPGATLANINGTRITFEEKHKQYTFKRKKNNYMPEEGTRWWYEAVKVVGSTKSTTTAPISQDVIDTALGIIKATGEAGIPEKDFSLAASKVAVLKPLWKSIGDGSFIRDQLKAGKVAQTADGNLAVVE